MRIPVKIIPGIIILLLSCKQSPTLPAFDAGATATKYLGNDTAWYMDNIPFFECSDPQLEQVYYYRWKMYKAHIRNTGRNEFVITEFINHVAWDRDPFCTINAASMHHIYEGRWLHDQRYMNGYINYLYQQGGNDRRYSESIADASYARFLVHPDTSFILQQLDSMKQKYEAWNDHLDTSKNLYYIPAMPDATEYTIASIDASGGTGGFDGGDAFRPSLNSYMYGNAVAIAQIALLKGDTTTARVYAQKAALLRQLVQQHLWNPSLQHFTDRYKQDNNYVHYWDFIRGRELVGLVPWYFHLPADDAKYSIAWKQVTDTTRLLGSYGLRTNEPSYEYYFKQIVYYMGQRGSQWNGPEWPYQTSLVLTAMANLLQDYHQPVVTNADYMKLLRMYCKQHYLPNGDINLVENYDPNLGGPIVYYYWSNHYNHSSFNNLIITGLCGIKPSAGDSLTIHPLADDSISYFALRRVNYHGHTIDLFFDRDGSKYKLGKGLHIFVDGVHKQLKKINDAYQVYTGPALFKHSDAVQENRALNIAHTGLPAPSASVNTTPDSSLYQAIDGRIWYFPEITNRWTTTGSASASDWFGIDFKQAAPISSVAIYFIADSKNFQLPDSIRFEYRQGDSWLPLKNITYPASLTGNTKNIFRFTAVTAKAIRVHFVHRDKEVAITEMECY